LLAYSQEVWWKHHLELFNDDISNKKRRGKIKDQELDEYNRIDLLVLQKCD
jgi:hypothetical protein